MNFTRKVKILLKSSTYTILKQYSVVWIFTFMFFTSFWCWKNVCKYKQYLGRLYIGYINNLLSFFPYSNVLWFISSYTYYGSSRWFLEKPKIVGTDNNGRFASEIWCHQRKNLCNMQSGRIKQPKQLFKALRRYEDPQAVAYWLTDYYLDITYRYLTVKNDFSGIIE